MNRVSRRLVSSLALLSIAVCAWACGTVKPAEQVAVEPKPTAQPTRAPTATSMPPTPTPMPTDTAAPSPTPIPSTPTPAGHAPVIVNLEDQSISDGERFSKMNLDEYVTDADHETDEIDWRISGNEELEVRFVGGNLFVSLPRADWTGSETLLFAVCDPDGLCASQEVTFTVRAENDAPVVSAGGQIVMPGETFAAIVLDDVVYDEDHANDELAWNVSGNDVLGVTVEEGIATITLPDADWRGQEMVRFEACDPKGACGSTEATFQVMDCSDAQAEVTYIMNAGFMIAVGDKKILIDALVQEPALPREVAGPLEMAQPPFDGVDLILATHSHFDHFSAEKVASHLEHNPEAVFVAPLDAVRMVNAIAGMQDQTIPIRLQQKAGEQTQLVVNGIGLECIFLSHGGDILNLGYVITAEGRRFFHTGDMDPDSVSVSALKGYDLPEKQIDIAFVAHFVLIIEEHHAHVTEGIQAGYVVPMHYQFTAPPPDYDLMAGYFPEAIVFHETMESWVLPGSSPPSAQAAGQSEAPMILIPAGPFVMGSEEGLADAPAHTVHLDDYTIDQYEVTNAQYAVFLNELSNQREEGARWLDAFSRENHLHEVDGVWQADDGYADHPVVEVTWYGAKACCAWRGARLPTEAEWEKAARGTDERTYPWGKEISCQQANYRSCSLGETIPVGSYPAGISPYGVHDMAGNAAEWTADWYASDYYETAPAENPPGPPESPSRRIASRGGSWYSSTTYLRTFHRNHEFMPTNSFGNVGFRCAASP